MNIDFYSKYLDVDFDKILLDNNNKLINSEEFYLKYKNHYFDETTANYTLYKQYYEEYTFLTKSQYNKTGSKYLYNFIDENKVEILKQKVKDVILKQERLYSNFTHYVNLLNTDVHKFETKKSKGKGFLSKFF
jgi:hypothetical protein